MDRIDVKAHDDISATDLVSQTRIVPALIFGVSTVGAVLMMIGSPNPEAGDVSWPVFIGVFFVLALIMTVAALWEAIAFQFLNE